MTIIDQCPVCNSKEHSAIFTVGKYPYFTTPVKKQDKAKILKKYGSQKLHGELQPVVCGGCLHIYLRKCAPVKILSELYRNYYSYPSALEGSFSPERDEAFIRIFKNKIRKMMTKKQNRILEIGCYDGYVLCHLKKMGFSVTGCDPSKGASIGKKFGLDIKKRFFKVDDFLKEGLKYEVIIFRHFLEHLPKPVDFLKALKEVLTPEGMLIFEVPNVEPYLKNGGTGIFSFQHLQYFSKASIYRLIENSDLQLMSCIETAENLIVAASRGRSQKNFANNNIPALCRSFRSNFKMKKTRLGKMVKKISDRGIILWGAGGFSANVLELYGVPSNRVKYIVDSDKNKWGMEYLKHRIQIASPETLKRDDHGCLMVCSMYANEIINRLRDLHYDKPVISLSPDIKLLKGRSK